MAGNQGRGVCVGSDLKGLQQTSTPHFQLVHTPLHLAPGHPLGPVGAIGLESWIESIHIHCLIRHLGSGLTSC